jgi:SOS-response transcriptional repressor LexA
MSIIATQTGRYSVLEVETPGGDVIPAGILLIDPDSDCAYPRLRRDWSDVASEEAEVLEGMEQALENSALELGASRLLAHLEDTLSNTFRIRDSSEMPVEDFPRTLSRLYRQYVPSTVRPFVTHLPSYSLAAAAGKFLDNKEVVEEGGWRAPKHLRIKPDMFVARVTGRSMSKIIPDGSLCVFRFGVEGSRNERRVLVEAPGTGGNDRYTVKRYRSVKTQLPGETWSHERIRLEPLNPEFEAWDLDPNEDRYRIFAEFVQVLD